MEEETLGIIEEVFPSDEDVINNLPATNDIEEPEDDPTIPTVDQDTGDPGGDTTPIVMELGERIEPDSGDVVSATENIVLEDEEVVAEEQEVTPLLTNIESLPTIGHVQEGDRVMIALVGGEPTVLGTVGSGDAQQETLDTHETTLETHGTTLASHEITLVAHERTIQQQTTQINSAVSAATAAQQIAEATGQHFWSDNNGAHVTVEEQGNWKDMSKTSYHNGPDVLLNSLGELFRHNDNNLLALLPAQYAKQTLTGDGTRTSFTLGQAPVDITKVISPRGYTIESNVLTFTTPPASGEAVTIEYIVKETFTGDGTTQDFYFKTQPSEFSLYNPNPLVAVTIDGVDIRFNETEEQDNVNQNYYWNNNQSIMINFAPAAGAEVVAIYTVKETFTGDGTTNTRTLITAPTRVVSVGVEITDYTLNAATITFPAPISNGTDVVVEYRASVTSVSIFDGKGNKNSNICAMFGERGTTIGYSDGSHIDIASDSITALSKTGEVYFKVAESSGMQSITINVTSALLNAGIIYLFIHFSEDGTENLTVNGVTDNTIWE